MIGNNAFLNSAATNWIYQNDGFATRYTQVSGGHEFYTAASGSANGNITWGTAKLTIASTGAATFSSSVTATTGTLSTAYNGGSVGQLHITSSGTEGGTITFEKTSGTAQKYKFGLGTTSLFIYNETAGNQPFTLTSGGTVVIGSSLSAPTGAETGWWIKNVNRAYFSSSTEALSINRYGSTGTMLAFDYGGAGVGSITTNGSTITFSGNALSDNRYKDNIETITNAVDAINKVDWVTFKYKDNQRDSAGVTAQQLQTVPELLKFVIDGIDEDSYKAVDYNAIIGYLGAAIKEQNQTIQSLQEQINILAK
jgi:hypothetical protein